MPEYVNRGPDARPLGAVGAWIQQRLSFKRATPPKQIKLGFIAFYWPPFVAIAIPYGSKFATLRFGWRWDENWSGGGYIADVIIKLREDISHL